MTLDQKQYVFFKKTKLLLFRKIWHSSISARLQNSRFRKAGSAVSVILECEAREPHTPARRENSLASLTILPRRFFTRSSLSFEYGPSLAFAKNTAVLQSTLRRAFPNCDMSLRDAQTVHVSDMFAVLARIQ